MNVKDLIKYVDKKERVTLKECLLIKSDFFLQKANVTINLVR